MSIGFQIPLKPKLPVCVLACALRASRQCTGRFNRVRDRIRTYHCSCRTEETFLQKIRKYISVHREKIKLLTIVSLVMRKIYKRSPPGKISAWRNLFLYKETLNQCSLIGKYYVIRFIRNHYKKTIKSSHFNL